MNIQGEGVDQLDLNIIKLLARDSRLSLRALAKELHTSVSTIHARLRKLVSKGVIRRFTVLTDYKALGYEITVIILAQVEGGHIADVGAFAAKDSRVIQVYDITGDYDLCIIAKFKSISELDSFVKQLNKLPYTKRTVTSLVLRVIKEDPSSPLL